jgi:hypothetical protein
MPRGEMPKVTVVNPWHWLNADGSLPLEPRLRKRVARVAQCIETAESCASDRPDKRSSRVVRAAVSASWLS